MSDHGEYVATLSSLERCALADEALATIRHDVRNRFAAIRNAAYYLRRKVGSTEAARSDARVEAFFQLIDEQLTASDLALGGTTKKREASRNMAPRTVGSCVARLLEATPSFPGHPVNCALNDVTLLPLDPLEIALLARLLVESSTPAAKEGSPLSIGTSETDEHLLIEVTTDTAQVAAPDAPVTHDSLALRAARRIAGRYGGEVELVRGQQTTIARARIPKASSSPTGFEDTVVGWP